MRFRSFQCDTESVKEMMFTMFKNMSNEDVNVAPLTIQGMNFADREYNIKLVFDGKRNNEKDYREESSQFWYQNYAETKLMGGCTEVELRTLIMHCFKASKGFEDMEHIYIPKDDKDIEFLVNYTITMIDKKIDMVR